MRLKKLHVYGLFLVIRGPVRGMYLVRCACGSEGMVPGKLLRDGGAVHCSGCAAQRHLHMYFERLRFVALGALQRATDREHACYEPLPVHSGWLSDTASFVRYLASLPGADQLQKELQFRQRDLGYAPGNLRFGTSEGLIAIDLAGPPWRLDLVSTAGRRLLREFADKTAAIDAMEEFSGFSGLRMSIGGELL